jgi:iron(III) transport system substrate-binding protein
MTRTLAALLGTAIAASTLTAAQAQELNLYSSRHYDTDERLYSDFTEATGITINRIEGNADELIARMQAEGANSPADVFLTVDTVRMARAGRARPSAIHRQRRAGAAHPVLPAGRRQPLVRLLAARADHLLRQGRCRKPAADLPGPRQPEYEGQVCIRSSTNVYTQNITAALIAHLGQEAVQDWAAGVVSNFARDPQGGDTDQLRGIVSGECDIAMSNTYYFARALRTDVDGLSVRTSPTSAGSSPNQNDIGAHVNISGGGVAANAPNRENADRVSRIPRVATRRRSYFSAGNDEYPAVPGVGLAPSVQELGIFRPTTSRPQRYRGNVDAAVEV